MSTPTNRSTGDIVMNEKQALARLREFARAALAKEGKPFTEANVQAWLKEQVDQLSAEGRVARSDQGKLYPTK